MTQAITQSWSAAQRRNGTDQIAPNGHDERDEPGTRDEQSQAWQHDERDEQSQAWQHDERDEQSRLRQHDNRGEQGLRRESYRQPGGVQHTMGESDGDRLERSTDWAKPATSTGGDTLAPVLAAWGQIYTSMFELAGDMMKLQQRTFTSLMGFADTNAERIASGDQRGRVHDALSASRTSSAVPDQIEQHRR